MNDLIRRDDVIKAIKGYWGSKINELPTENSEDGEIITDVRKANEYLEHNKQLCLFVELIKTVEVAEPKRGRWIVGHKTSVFDLAGVETWAVRMTCSECSFSLNFVECHTSQYGFCPNCGARME